MGVGAELGRDFPARGRKTMTDDARPQAGREPGATGHSQSRAAGKRSLHRHYPYRFEGTFSPRASPELQAFAKDPCVLRAQYIGSKPSAR